MARSGGGRYFLSDREAPPPFATRHFPPDGGSISRFAIISSSRGKPNGPIFENLIVAQVVSGELYQVCKTESPMTAIGPLLVNLRKISKQTKSTAQSRPHGDLDIIVLRGSLSQGVNTEQ